MYAGFWKRLAAAMLDLTILLVPMVLLGIVVALITGPKSTATLAADFSSLALPWLYFAGMESSRKQATFGKIAFGIRVVDLNGSRISFARATARLLSKTLSALSLFVGFLMAAVPRRKQALHDIVAGCLVINSEASRDQLERGLPTRVPSAAGIVAIALAVVCIPLAAAGAAAYMARHKAPPPSLGEARAAPSSPHLRGAVITSDGESANAPPRGGCVDTRRSPA